MFQTQDVEKIKTRFLYSIKFSENRVFYEIILKNTVQPDRPQTTVWRMRIAYWVTKTTDTHSEYVIIYLLLFHGNNSYANAPHGDVYSTMTVLCSI
jgi:hypothetical protein